MTTRKFYYLLMVIAFSPFCLFGQIPASTTNGNDPNYSSTTMFSDNFPSGETFGSGSSYAWDYVYGTNTAYGYSFSTNMVTTLSTGGLQLEAAQNPTYPKSGQPVITGGILNNTAYGYGYYAAQMELPCYGMDYDDWLGLLGGNNFCTESAPYFYNELDNEILNSSITTNPPIVPTYTSPLVDYTTNTHVGYNATTCNCNTNTGGCQLTLSSNYMEKIPSVSLTTSYHIYSFEWTFDHIIWYFDGIPFRMVHQAPDSIVPYPPMNVWLDVTFYDPGPSYILSRNTFPGYMNVNYVKLYTFSNWPSTNWGPGCPTTPNNYTTSGALSVSPSNPFNQIYTNITITSNSGNTSITNQTSTDIIMRASGTTTIYGPFTAQAPTSGAFVILPTACN